MAIIFSVKITAPKIAKITDTRRYKILIQEYCKLKRKQKYLQNNVSKEMFTK